MGQYPEILVTGACGFLGTHLLERLVDRGCHVTVLDDFSVGRRPAPHQRIEIAEGDIADPAFVRGVVSGRDFRHAYHLAALHYIPRCEREPREAMMTNVAGTRNLVEALSDAPGLKSLIFASTMAIYTPSREVASEQAETIPTDVYGWTKLMSEDLVRGAAARAGWSAICCRLSNLVGPGETNPHLFPEIAKQIASGLREIEVGNLTPMRNYVHVEDVADLLMQAMGLESCGFCPINIGSDEEYSVEQVLAKFSAQTGGVRFVSTAERQRAVDRPRLQPDTTRMRQMLGVTRRTVDAAIAEVLAENAAQAVA